LALLSLYRDWRVLIPAVGVMGLDYGLRSAQPLSTAAGALLEQWPWFEPTAWMLETAFLIVASRRGVVEMREMAHRQAELEATNAIIEAKVDAQTAELRGREALLRSVTSASPVGVFRCSGVTGAMDYVNERCATILGRDASELRCTGWQAVLRGADLVALEGAMNSGVEFALEVMVWHPDGSERCVRIRGTPLDPDQSPACVGTIEDVTDTRAMEQERERLGRAVAHAADAIMITNLSGTIEYVNPAFEDITGYRLPEVRGATPRIFKSGRHDAAFYQRFWQTILRGDVWVGEFMNRRKNGETFEAAATVSGVRNELGQLTHFVQVMRDVTERRTLEAELREAQRLESIGQLAAGVAHEINTPIQYVGDNLRFLADAFRDLLPTLQTIQALCEDPSGHSANRQSQIMEAAQAADLPFIITEVPAALAQTIEGVERVAGIVRSMRACSLEPRATEARDVNELLANAVAVCSHDWKRVAHLEFDLQEQLGSVHCVPSELIQAFVNIIVNAAHAMPDPVDDQPASRGVIRISTALVDNHVEIRIADTGQGMSEEVRSRVFDPFFTTRPVGTGSGQGLSFAYRVVRAHRGTIAVDSDVGKGTTVTIRLPATPAMSEAPAVAMEDPADVSLAEPSAAAN
jgi:PAS domain S-box-containing protein